MIEAIKAVMDKKELPAMEPGTMSYMMSKQGYLNDRDGHWHPHVMFFTTSTEPAAWGADLQGSPVLAFNDTWEHLTIFMVRCDSGRMEPPTAKETCGSDFSRNFLKHSRKILLSLHRL